MSEYEEQQGSEAALTVAIIPARGGSKGVPRKNLRRVGGVPLVERAVGAAAAASTVDIVVVTTDDEEIAAVSAAARAQVVRRPAELAGDAASSESAVLHVLEELAADGVAVGTVVFLQATSPFIPVDGIDEAVRMLRDDGFDSVFSAHETYGFLWRRDGDRKSTRLNSSHTSVSRMPSSA